MKRNCQKFFKGAELCEITPEQYAEYWAEADSQRSNAEIEAVHAEIFRKISEDEAAGRIFLY